MIGISKQTFLQLVKEFRIPFLAAAGWTTYAVWGPEVSFKNVIETFGTSFFLASWMTGQIFRVRKQAGVEASFENVEQRLTHLVSDLEIKTQKMINHITGGDSYLYFFPAHFIDTKILWVAIHKGQYPLQQVMVSIVDMEHFNSVFTSRDHTTNYQIGDFHCGTSKTIGENETGDRDRFSFNITTHARNGKFTQQTQFDKIEGSTRIAIRIKGPSGVIYEEVHPDFPVNAEGNVDWDKPHFTGSDLPTPRFPSPLETH